VLLLTVVLVSTNVRESRKRVIVAARVMAPTTSSDFFLLVVSLCSFDDVDAAVVVIVIQSECTSPILANFQTTIGSKMATGKIDRNVVLHPEYSAMVAPISKPRIEPLANIDVITP
jgi:hypothetical protein